MPLLLQAFFLGTAATLLYIRPSTSVHCLLKPSSFNDQIPPRIAVRVRPPSFLQFLTLVFHGPCHPVHILGCFSSIFFTSCGHATYSQDYRHPPFKKQGVPLSPLNAQKLCVWGMTAPARLLTRFHLCAFRYSLLHLLILTPSAQKSVGKVDNSSSTSMQSDSESDYVLSAAAVCRLYWSLSVC